MTTPLNTFQLALIRSMTQGSMMDFCTINGKTVTTGSYGEPVETSGSIAATACGVTWVGGKEKWGSVTTLPYEATIRLPIETTINNTNTITVTKRFGEDITPVTFEIVSSPRYGFDLLVDVKRIS